MAAGTGIEWTEVLCTSSRPGLPTEPCYGSALGPDIGGVDDLLVAKYDGAFLRLEPDLCRDPLGWDVRGIDDRDQALQAKGVSGEVATGGRGLGGIALALQVGADVVAQLDLFRAVNSLRGQPAVAGKLASSAENHGPQAEPALAVELLIPVDPRPCFIAAFRRRVVAHHLCVAKQRSNVVEIGAGHLAQDQPTGSQSSHSRNATATPAARAVPDELWQHRAGPADHLTDPGQPGTPLDQLHMRSGTLTRQRHAQIIDSKPPGAEPTPKLVQSTGQIGGATPKAGGRLLDGRTWDQYPASTGEAGPPATAAEVFSLDTSPHLAPAAGTTANTGAKRCGQ
jgi:hypothetical protein